MKRYKEDIRELAEWFKEFVDRIVLEEVKEGRKCPNCHGKKLEDCWCSPETFMCSCHDKEDQPLTPKDLGWIKGQAMYEFEKWLWENDGTVMRYLTDEEFDRLYQEFLREKLTDK